MANRLKKMLTEEMVRLDPPLLSTPEEVIEYCGNILVENKKAKAGYVKRNDRFLSKVRTVHGNGSGIGIAARKTGRKCKRTVY